MVQRPVRLEKNEIESFETCALFSLDAKVVRTTNLGFEPANVQNRARELTGRAEAATTDLVFAYPNGGGFCTVE